jgi:hypothetical protein
MMSQIFDVLILAVFLGSYFGVPYLLLKRGWIVRAGLTMFVISIVGIGLVVFASPGSLGASSLIFLLFPLPLIFIFVGLLSVLMERMRRTGNK